MRFFHILAGPNDPANALFAAACRLRGIGYVPVAPGTLQRVLGNPPTHGDLLYCSGSSLAHWQVEALLTVDGVTTFDRLPDSRYFRWVGGRGLQTMLLERSAVPVPRTAYHLGRDRHALAAAVDSLGGFPVVVKANEGQFGIGVTKVSGPTTLRSVIDFLRWKGDPAPFLQEFVDHSSTVTLLCLGDRAVVGRRRMVPANEFRSNSIAAIQSRRARYLDVHEFSDTVRHAALSAIGACGRDCAAVTVIEAQNGRSLVTRVHSPFAHADLERSSGVPISTMMIDFLADKSACGATEGDTRIHPAATASGTSLQA